MWMVTPSEMLSSSERADSTVSQSQKLAIEKSRGSNEHPVDHRNNNIESVPVWENGNSMAISELDPGDTPSIGAKPIVHKTC